MFSTAFESLKLHGKRFYWVPKEIYCTITKWYWLTYVHVYKVGNYDKILSTFRTQNVVKKTSSFCNQHYVVEDDVDEILRMDNTRFLVMWDYEDKLRRKCDRNVVMICMTINRGMFVINILSLKTRCWRYFEDGWYCSKCRHNFYDDNLRNVCHQYFVIENDVDEIFRMDGTQ